MEKLNRSYMGPILKQARITAKMTLEDLSERIGKTARYMQAFENKERGVSLDTLFKLVWALAISAEDIAYPDWTSDNRETEQLIRSICLLNNRDRSVMITIPCE